MIRTDLVTGGAGYFGGVMVEHLLAAGREVRVLDLLEPRGGTWIRGDIRDPAVVARACEGVDVVHHDVAVVPVAKDPERFWSVNVEGTRVLLRAAAEAGVRKVVNVSSSAVYGVPARNPVDERTAPAPVEPYGAAKLAGERLCLGQDRVDVTVVRPRTIVGPGRLGLLQLLFEWVRAGRTIPVIDGGAGRYQFVHADDLASACLLAAERPGVTSYNVGAREVEPLRVTLERLVAHAGSESRVRSVPSWLVDRPMRALSRLPWSPLAPYHAAMYSRSLWFDGAKAEEELGWSARRSTGAAFAEAYDWYVAHRDEVLRAEGSEGSSHRSAVRPGLLRAVARVLDRLP